MAQFQVVRGIYHAGQGIVAWEPDSSERRYRDLDAAVMVAEARAHSTWGVRVIDGSTDPENLAPWEGQVIIRVAAGEEKEDVR